MADSKKLLCTAAGGALAGVAIKGASDKKKEKEKDDGAKKALKVVLGVSAAAIGVNMIGMAASGKGAGSAEVSAGKASSSGTHQLSHDDKMRMLEASPVSDVKEASSESSFELGS